MRTHGWVDAPKLLVVSLFRTVIALAATEQRLPHRPMAEVPRFPPLELRLARRQDVPGIQRCNLATLPENYNQQFYSNHLKEWPDLAFVAIDNSCSVSQSTSSFPGSGVEEKVVAYVLGKVEEREAPNPTEDIRHKFHDHARFFDPWPHQTRSSYRTSLSGSPTGLQVTELATERMGHVTSLAVLEPYRRRGLAVELMKQLHYHLSTIYQVESVGLHVRLSNRAAERLYSGFGYQAVERMPAYYQDGEDAQFMKKSLAVSTRNASFMGGVIRRKPCWEVGPIDCRLPRTLGIPDLIISSDNDDEETLLTGSM